MLNDFQADNKTTLITSNEPPRIRQRPALPDNIEPSKDVQRCSRNDDSFMEDDLPKFEGPTWANCILVKTTFTPRQRQRKNLKEKLGDKKVHMMTHKMFEPDKELSGTNKRQEFTSLPSRMLFLCPCLMGCEPPGQKGQGALSRERKLWHRWMRCNSEKEWVKGYELWSKLNLHKEVSLL
jgi:hypothetical protein